MDKLLKLIITRLFNTRKKVLFRKKISSIYRNLPSRLNISGENIKKHRALWSVIGSRPDPRWYISYASINGIDDPGYITEYDFYTRVEPVLNNRSFGEAFSDKNLYHRLIDNDLLPPVFLRRIHNQYYTGDYRIINGTDEPGNYIPSSCESIILKKSIDSGGGRDVILFSREGDKWKSETGELLDGKYLDENAGRNFIIQDYIHQHSFYARFNKTSVNTVRLFTYRSVKTNEIVPLQAVLRIGRPGSIVDNMASGGIACGISSDGLLNDFGVNKSGSKISDFNGVDFKNVGKVFNFDTIVETGKSVASSFYYHRLLGFDFSVDKNGDVKIIEVNNRNNEINFFQMNNGPLFGEYTGEIVEYCRLNPKNFLIDFEYR